jgi:putative MATE family efflux protein
MQNERLSPRRQLFSLTWPIFLEAVLFSIIGSVDTLMLSRYNDNAVGAVGVANSIMSLFQVISNIITAGTGILCAQYIGAGRTTKEKQPLIMGALLVNGLLGILFSLAVGLGAPWLLTLMGVEETQFEYARQYLSLVGSFLFVQMIAVTFSSLIRAHGKTKASMVFSLVMNAINITLNYILIYGKLGLPVMGAQGAAIATVVSKCIMCVAAAIFLFRFVLPDMSFRPDWKAMRPATGQILAIGSPAAGEQISYTLSKLVVMAMVTSLGAVAVNTYSYVNIVVSYVYLFSMAIGQGTSIMVGWEAGRRQPQKAKSICRFSTNVSTLFAIGALGILCLVRRPLMGVFTKDAAIITMGAAVILSDFVLELGRSRNLVLVNALRAAGDVRYPLYIGLFSMWFFSVGMSWLLGIVLNWGLVGIWIGLGLDECFRAVLLQLRWQSEKWTKFVKV